jgi:uncharacterized protein
MRSRTAGKPVIIAAELICFVLLVAISAHAAMPTFPSLTGRVVDDANILNSATRQDLTEALARHEQATGEQVVVVTLPSLQGYTIEDFGYQLGRAWGIGQRGTNTGALLIVAPNEHKVRIEVGYGLEGKLTDAESRVIIDRDILPAFRRGDSDAGVTAGVAAILTALGGDLPEGQPRGDKANSWLPGHPEIPLSPLIILGIYLLVYLLFSYRTNRYQANRRGVWRTSNYDPPFGGGGFGGDGGFSGGGGSFGGGGASGGW